MAIYDREKTIDPAVVSTIYPTVFDLLLRRIYIFKDLF